VRNPSQLMVFSPSHPKPDSHTVTRRRQRIAKDDIPTLCLEQFCNPPVIDFGIIPFSSNTHTYTQRQTMRIQNTSLLQEMLIVEKISPGITLFAANYNDNNNNNNQQRKPITTLPIAAASNTLISIQWTIKPSDIKHTDSVYHRYRENIILKWNNKFRLRIVVLSSIILPFSASTYGRKQNENEPKRPSRPKKVLTKY